MAFANTIHAFVLMPSSGPVSSVLLGIESVNVPFAQRLNRRSFAVKVLLGYEVRGHAYALARQIHAWKEAFSIGGQELMVRRSRDERMVF